MRLKKNKHILSAICSGQWLIEEDYFKFMLSVADGEGNLQEAMAEKAEITEKKTVIQSAVKGTDVAVIPVIGPIIPRAAMFSKVSGITNLDDLNSMLDEALRNPDVGKILFYFDSPGGHATGINEFADKIYESRGIKPIEGYVSGTAASASFWLASAVDKLSIDATARLGSVGVVVAVPKNDDEVVEIVNSNSPKKRLDPEKKEDKAEYVRYLDSMADVFFEKLSRNFGIDDVAYVQEHFGKGGVRVGADAVKNRMAHEISSLQKVVDRLATESTVAPQDVAAPNTFQGVSFEEKVENEFVDTGGSMTKAELIEKHPELFNSIVEEAIEGKVEQAKFDSLEQDYTALQNDHKELVVANASMSKVLADNIFSASFDTSDLPVALKPKFEKLVDYKEFVAENGILDGEGYQKSVAAEIAEWSDAANFGQKEKEIAGLAADKSGDLADAETSSEEEADETIDRMLAYVSK